MSDYLVTYREGDREVDFIVYHAADLKDAVLRFEKANPGYEMTACNLIRPNPNDRSLPVR